MDDADIISTIEQILVESFEGCDSDGRSVIHDIVLDIRKQTNNRKFAAEVHDPEDDDEEEDEDGPEPISFGD